jgi:hypothetical protein
MSVLGAILSLVTWIPALLVFALESSMEPWSWTRANLWLAGSIVGASVVWIAVLSLIGLSLSAWVRWRLLAGAAVLGVFFVGAGLANLINVVLRTTNGTWLDLQEVMRTIWLQMLKATPFSAASPVVLSTSDAWTALAVTAGICLMMLAVRIRPFEVVR